MPPSSSSEIQADSDSETENPQNLALRRCLVSRILEKTGFEAREFQVQAAQAVLDGDDLVVHAGTGSGKTLIFIAPHFVLENKVSIVISPLILLQNDQQERMKRMGVSAIALNKEVHIDPKTWREIAEGKYKIILLSPEMALHSEDVHKTFDNNIFRKALIAIHIDEAHTISLWGGDFRKDYQGLGRVRARLPKGVPVSLVSATLRPNVKQDAMSTLGFASDASKYTDINVGNERDNVFIGVCPMQYPASSFKDILRHFDPNETDPYKIPSTIIYIDNVNNVTFGVIALYKWLHPLLRGKALVMPVHAWMTPKYHSEAMAKFAAGEVRVIFATEAAGMGCDISNIKRVIQFGKHDRFADAFMQRIGRAWRGPDRTGEGWLIYEKWVPTCNQNKVTEGKEKASTSKKGKTPTGNGKPEAHNGSQHTSNSKTERKCDRLMQKLVTEIKCRREFLDRVYNNPTREIPVPPHKCCDLCDPNSATRLVQHKFPPKVGQPRAARVSGQSNPDMLACLRTWRKLVFPSAFGCSSLFGASVLISNDEIERISRCAPLRSIAHLRTYLVKWRHIDSQLESMWEALKAGGFALPDDSVEERKPEPTPKTRTAPTTRPATIQTKSSSAKSRRRRGNALSPRSSAVVPGSSTRISANDIWWREERNYEVRRSTMDDFQRLFAGNSQVPKESTKDTRPSKRPRLDYQGDSCRSPARLPPTPLINTAPPMSTYAQPTFRAPARPVGRMIVPSQRPHLPPIPPSTWFASPAVHQIYRAPVAVAIQHPSPIRLVDFTYFGIPRAPTFAPRISASHQSDSQLRPSHTLTLNR